MQENYATNILPNVIKFLHSTLAKPNNLNDLLDYRRERIVILNDLLNPLANTRFNQVFYKKLRREDSWGKDSIIMDHEENNVEPPVTFVGVANADDGGPSSFGGEGVIEDSDPTGV
ncbi:unnamed protein product [Cunninghamella echinulata]